MPSKYITDKKHNRKGKQRKRGVDLKANERVLRPIRVPKKIGIRYGELTHKAVQKTKRIIMQKYTDTGLEQFEQSLDELYENIDEWDEAKVAANDMVFDGNVAHSKAFYAAAEQAVGFNFRRYISEQGLDDIMESAVDENVKALTDLKDTSQRRISQLINRVLIEQTGKTVSLRQELLKAFDIDDGRARFIARDQTQRYMNSLNKFRQTKAGIKKYMWITSKDQRVRPSHQLNSRKVFTWERPPLETGHPGHDYNCRCTASAILEV